MLGFVKKLKPETHKQPLSETKEKAVLQTYGQQKGPRKWILGTLVSFIWKYSWGQKHRIQCEIKASIPWRNVQMKKCSFSEIVKEKYSAKRDFYYSTKYSREE